MRKALRILFTISDILAWLLAICCIIAALTYPSFGPSYARMHHEEITLLQMLGTVFVIAFTGLGAHLLTQRRPIGLAMALALALLFLWHDAWWAALGYTLAILVLFGTPLLLLYLDMKSAAANTPEPKD